jgi:hypothetical protein
LTKPVALYLLAKLQCRQVLIATRGQSEERRVAIRNDSRRPRWATLVEQFMKPMLGQQSLSARHWFLTNRQIIWRGATDLLHDGTTE